MNIFSGLSNWYFSKKALPYWCILAIDCLIVYVSAFAVCMVNNVELRQFEPIGLTAYTIGFYTLFYIIGFRLFRTYSGIVRYSSFVDLQRMAFACLLGFALSVLVRVLTFGAHWLMLIRIRDMFIWTALAAFGMWSLRVLVKYFYDTYYRTHSAERAFIYGVRQGGASIAKSIRNQDPAMYMVDGFVTDNDAMAGSLLMGVKIYPIDKNLVPLMVNRGVKALFVSPLRSESLRENQDFVNALIQARIKIFMVPPEQEWDGKSDISHQMLREIQIEDLLPREKIEVDMEAIGNLLRGKRILITGAAGSIGSEMVRQVALYDPAQLILIDQAETPLHDIRLMMARNFPNIDAPTIVADIANRTRMADIFARYKPQYVFHAAAYKHVPMMEDNPSESIQNNIEGTRIVADLSVKHGALKFVMVSTDKAVNPTNVMGCSKRICEIYVQSLDKAIKDHKVEGKTQFVTTRFGNVLGSNGSVIPLFKEQIRNGGPITVTHPDIIRYFMLIPEACKLVLEAGTMGHGGEIFVFDMGKPVKIVDLAQRMIDLSGAKIEIKFTGLRDGEKLYEEVLNEAETTLPTYHKKIKIARVREYDYGEVLDAINDLFVSSTRDDAMEIVRRMKALVPEFKSQNSIYQSLDRAD